MKLLAGIGVLFLLGTCAWAQNTDNANLVVNPGFETAGANGLPQGWSGDVKVFSRVGTPVHGGQGALQYVNADPKNYQLLAQTVPLQPGKMYEFSVWVKTENVTGDDSGATICVEYSGPNGEYLGGAYPSGFKGTRDWSLVKGRTGRVPEKATTCRVVCYLRREMVGKAWFDDVSLTRWREAPLQTMLVSPNYRGTLTPESTQVVVSAAVSTEDYDLEPNEVEVQCEVLRADTERIVGSAKGTPTGKDCRLTIPVSNLAVGAYRLRTLLVREADGKPLGSDEWRLQVVAPETLATRAAYIDEHNRVIVDGKPFLPLGMYFSSLKEDELKEYAGSAFNCVMPYGMPDRAQMDLAQSLGLKVIYSLKDIYYGTEYAPKDLKATADERTFITNRVQEYRNHPALLAWYLNDELPADMADRLEAHQQWLEDLDPGHPTWVVLYQVGEVAAYRKTFDVIGTDPYPIPSRPAAMAGDWARITRESLTDSRPVWMVPQAHDWGMYEKNPARKAETRPPTLAEMRSMAWQCLAEGATGLVFYSWFDLKRDDKVGFAGRWADMKQVAAEIKPYSDMLLSVAQAPEITARPQDWLHWMVRQVGADTYLVVVNADAKAHETTFKLPAQPKSVALEGAAEPAKQTGVTMLPVELEPFGVKVYKLTF